MILEFLFLLFQKNESVGRWETKHFMGMVLVETSWFDNIFILLCLNDHDWCSYKLCGVSPLKSLCDDSDLQTSEYRIYYSNVKLTPINVQASRCQQPLRLCMRKKILRSANAKYHSSYLFFYKMNKGDSPLMYFCVFWCEFIAVYSVFLAVIVWPLSLSS